MDKIKRLRFTRTLSSLSAIYGGILAYRLIGYQSDAISDIVKFSILIFIVTLIASYVWWSLIMRKIPGIKGGALAGFLSAICVIPVPTFAGAFKASFLDQHDILLAVKLGLQYSLSTFSLAEALVIPLSVIVGIWAAK